MSKAAYPLKLPASVKAALRDHTDAMAHFIVDLFLEQHAASAKDDDASGV